MKSKETEVWNPPETFGEELQHLLHEAGRGFTFSSSVMPSPESGNEALIPLSSRILASGYLQCDPDVFYQISEEQQEWVIGPRHQITFSLNRGLLLDLDSHIGNITMIHGSYGWECRHRFVSPSFRGKQIFPRMLEAMESFIQGYADTQKESQKLSVNLGQPKVLKAFRKHKYIPASPEDAEAVRRMENPDDSVFLDHAYHEKYDTLTGQATYIVDEEKDPYLYDKAKVNPQDRSQLREKNALRLTLVKTLEPSREQLSLLTMLQQIQQRIQGQL